MRKAGLVLIVLLFSCGSNKTKTEKEFYPGEDLPEVFELTTDTQDAIFYIGYGYTGCGSQMPILDPATGDPKLLNGCCISFDHTYGHIVETKVPTCFIEQPEIKVVARIYLKQEKGFYSTEEIRSYQYYEAKVVRLGKIFVNAEPCFINSEPYFP